ncbi:MAG: thiamine pyrophosphate-dependent enzyme [Planctomycetaceae bacterium]|nr:thiamine pyrophosphate-dependent enzyme [Planctomycetaceae bacterium]
MARLEALGDVAALNNTTPVPERGLSIGQYLIRRLQDYGIRDVFGIPGDYILTFYGLLEKSPLRVVGCTREDNAGFAADAYARIHGMGCVVVTYCVGGLSVCNSVAGAYAEKSPVVVISGAPGLGERVNNPLLHHKVRDFHTQIEVFEKLCIAGTELEDPVVAFREIDRVLDAAARFKRPVYIELPRDMVEVVPHIAHAFHAAQTEADPQVLAEAADEASALLAKAQRPIIIAGVEIHRFGLQEKVLSLAEKHGLPIAATILGKSVVPEKHPLYIGLYEGAMGHAEVTRFVEESDCVLLLGAFMTDLNLGIFTAQLDPANCIYVTSEQLRIRHHHYHQVPLGDFLDQLRQREVRVARREIPAELRPHKHAFQLDPSAKLSIRRLIARVDEQIDANTIVIADIGDALFAASELTIHEQTDFLSPAYYTSMGFSVPAALGALTARPDARVLVICGDGAFQMTGMELSTIVRHGYAPIVIVLDNHGYGTERFLHPGNWQFNEIHPWKYHQLPALLGGGTGYEVRTEKEFDAALNKAWNDKSGPSLIQAHIPVDDASDALKRLTERLSKRV